LPFAKLALKVALIWLGKCTHAVGVAINAIKAESAADLFGRQSWPNVTR
jgi:hypothetical protein